MTELLLSDIIKTAPKFSFFEELISIPNKELQAHDFLKINKIIDDIGLYLKELEVIFNQIKASNIESNINIEWYFEGGEQIYELNRNLENVDSVISRLLLVLELPVNSKHLQFTHLLTKCEQITDVSLEVKKHLVTMKRKIDISINYKELKDITMDTLTREIEDCVKLFLKLDDLTVVETKLDSTLSELVHKMQTNSISFTKSVMLPTFNDGDEKMYNQFIDLETKLEPLRVSINFLPLRIEEFLHICGEMFPDCIGDINNGFGNLVERWDYLMECLQKFKTNIIKPKWDGVFRFVIDETTKIIDALIHEFTVKENRRITKKIGERYKLCSNAINIIKKALTDGLVSEPNAKTSFNEQVLMKWTELNRCLVLNQNYDDISNYTGNSEFSGLKSFQTLRSASSPTRTASVTSPVRRVGSDDISMGLGIDLGIDVETSKVPFSIKPANKITDFESELGKSNKPSLLHEFKLTKHKSKSASIDEESSPQKGKKDHIFTEPMSRKTDTILDDEETLVSKHKPELDQDLNELIKKVKHVKLDNKSRIPTIDKDYIKKGYKKIPAPKPDKRSRIPVINAKHKVLLSPTRSVKSVNSDYTDHLNSPIRFEKIRKKSSRVQSEPIVMKGPINMRSPSLNLTNTPNLAFTDTSPYNPYSSPYSPGSNLNSPRSHSATSYKSTQSRERCSSPVGFIGSGGSGRRVSRDFSPGRGSPISYRSTSPERPESSLGSRFDDEHLLQPLNIKPSWK